jgi:NAD(P)H-dependent flavin oxidoreductase YrpB (nitropropane dioxygenase family)
MMIDSEKLDAAIGRGNTDLGFMPAGQISGAIQEVKPAGEVVSEIMEEAEEVLSRLAEKHLELEASR